MLSRLARSHEVRAVVRIVAAALAAFLVGRWLGLPGVYTAVLSTVIVVRPDSEGTLRAGLERLAATLLGAGTACLASYGPAVGLPEVAVLLLALTPVAVLAAWHPPYRTGMVAAVIVLSTGGGVLHVALLRTLEIGLGAVVGTLVSLLVLPLRRTAVVRRRVADLLPDLADALRHALAPAEAPLPERRQARIRRGLRELALLLRGRGKARRPDHAGLLVRSVTRLHADIAFIARTLDSMEAERRAALRPLGEAFAGLAARLSAALRDGGPPPDLAPLRALREAVAAGPPGLLFLFGKLLEDLGALAHALPGKSA